MTSLIPKVIFCLDAENITRSGSSSKANQNTTAAEVHAIDELVAQNDTIAHKYNHQLPTKPHDNQWNDQYTLLSTVQLQSKLRKHRSLGVQNLSKQTSDIYRLRNSDNLWYYHFTYL